MRIKHLIINIIFFAPLFLGAQNFQIQDQFGFGSIEWDNVYSAIETNDGGFLFCARTDADISGDKTTANYGSLDIWLVKTNSTGTILWQKSFGGNSNDAGFSLIQTLGGNFLISGSSISGVSGNKTSPHYGGGDIWLIKINDTGDIIWQNTYGGNIYEFYTRTKEQPNGDLICTGNTNSEAHSGTRIDSLQGTYSLWTLHLDSSGNIKNEFCYGGSLSDFGDNSFRLSSNSYLFTGASNSGSTLDKTEPSFGETDFWLVKTDTNGVITKDKTIGGILDDFPRGSFMDSDNNILLTAFTKSPASGNKTAPSIGNYDLWLVKLDTNLDIIWDKSYGGLLEEKIDFEGGFYSNHHNMSIICGSTESPQIGDKISESFGGFDYWVIGIDDNGNKVMEISLGGTEDDFANSILETSNHELLIVGQSESSISGNKTIQTKGGHDVWVVKLDITVSINEVIQESFNAYPVPASTILNFSVPLKGDEVTAELVDINGRTVLSQVINNSDNGQFNVTPLISGTYFLKLSGTNFSYSRMVVIE